MAIRYISVRCFGWSVGHALMQAAQQNLENPLHDVSELGIWAYRLRMRTPNGALYQLLS